MSTRPDLVDVIRAIAAGAKVDWSAVDAPADQSTHALLESLEILSRVAEAHGSVPSSESPDPESSARAPNADGGEPGERHSWGPLALLERVGSGAYGDVYRAWDTRLDREVALKLLHIDVSAATSTGTVIEEGRMLARVRHENVVTVFGADRIDGRVGIWTEYIDGQTLEESLQQKVFGPEEAASIGLAVCRGLAAVHRAGLVHGDIKSTNVMRDDSGRVVLMDFGASAHRDAIRRPGTAGTPLYMAPEVLRGERATIRADIYGVGVLLYRLVTGGYPVMGATLAEIRDAHRSPARPSLADLNPALPECLVNAVERALMCDPGGRYASADDLADALAGTLPSANPPAPASAFPTWGVAAILVLTIGIATTVGLYLTRAPGAQTALNFEPHDYVLITRFENRTGENVFDGAVEYALQREFSESTVIGLVPEERVENALVLMKRPRDTVIDREVGREIALRDGHIKAVLSGRVERFGASYVVTAQLIDPSNDAVVATIGSETTAQSGVLAALQKQAVQVRTELGEKLNRIRGADPNVEPAATASLQAFQLYNQSYRFGRDGNWQAALEVARQVVKLDPEFASGWIWLAWAVKNTERINARTPDDPRIAAYRDFAERAMQLTSRVPEWERHWVTGSYYTLTIQPAKAIPHYQALLRLRPDHFYALNNLNGAINQLHRPEDYPWYVKNVQEMATRRDPNRPTALAWAVTASVDQTESAQSAKPFLDRLDLLAKSGDASGETARFYRDFGHAYARWRSGDLNGALKQVNAIAATVDSYPRNLRVETVTGVSSYYMAMGRARDRRRFWASLSGDGDREQAERRQAEERADLPSLRRLLGTASHPPHRFIWGPNYVRAGMLDEARLYVEGKSPNYDPGHAAITEGQLSLLAGEPEKAAQQLERAMDLTSMYNDPTYFWGCESLADALWKINRRDDATKWLERCSANNFKTVGVWGVQGFERSTLDLHLADLYRLNHNLQAAEQVEARIRARLALADEDFPLLVELNRRH